MRSRYEIVEGSTYKVSSGLNSSVAHDYLAINTLGNMDFTPREVMTRMQQDWSKVFPGGARGKDGTGRVFVGQVFRLPGPRKIIEIPVLSTPLPIIGIPKIPWFAFGNYVRVMAMSPTTVTVVTLAEHIFTGQVENGIFADASNEMWIYQRGTGHDTTEQRIANYASAPFLWYLAAEKVRSLIKSMASSKRLP